MSRRRGGGGDPEPIIGAVYEGPEVLSALLARAGSPNDAEEVAREFQRAQDAGEPRSAAIPGLFPDEPRFESPDAARRLYSNLFGLWARVQAGLGVRDDTPAASPVPAVVAEPPPPPMPERGSVSGDVVPREVVEAVWKGLAALPERELVRRRDRYTNAQPDLVAWLDAAPLPESGALAATDLAFEAWAMFDQAFGDRLGTVDWKELRAVEAEPPAIERIQPALAAYVAEQLELVADEDQSFGAEPRAQVEKVAATIVAGLTGAVTEPS